VESLLNILWLLFVAAGACVCVRQRTDGSGWRAVVVFACVAVLLFPAISMTDDLHQSFMMVEDSSKRLSHSLPPAADISLGLLSIAALFALLLRTISHSWAPALRVCRPRVGFNRWSDGRAPPAFAA
jgi:hypothetical protein